MAAFLQTHRDNLFKLRKCADYIPASDHDAVEHMQQVVRLLVNIIPFDVDCRSVGHTSTHRLTYIPEVLEQVMYHPEQDTIEGMLYSIQSLRDRTPTSVQVTIYGLRYAPVIQPEDGQYPVLTVTFDGHHFTAAIVTKKRVTKEWAETYKLKLRETLGINAVYLDSYLFDIVGRNQHTTLRHYDCF